jgi:two-component system sensor histidine kinase PhoQ
LLAASLVLAAFLGLTGLALDRAFQSNAEAALRDRLQGNIYALLAAADLDVDGELRLPEALPEARFSTPGSGLYALVARDDGSPVWRSPSALGLALRFGTPLTAGERRYATLTLADGTALLALSFGVSWETGQSTPRAYTFSAAEDLQTLHADVQRFRTSLWSWLGGAALLLLVVQGSILRWSLAPLRQLAADLTEIESGRQSELVGRYPRELHSLTDNLNALIRHEHAHLERYRHALDDLAHSLKTPLAVLRGALESGQEDSAWHAALREQVERMKQIVHYQLQRAATSGRTTLVAPVPLAEAARKITASLSKVYADKDVQCRAHITAEVLFYGDEGDLLEMLGCLADNAYKYCRKQVTLQAHNPTTASLRHPGVEFSVEDDGPGIPAERAARALQRGVRLDMGSSGQGIGLAIVQDIVRVYGGELAIGQSELGGARVTVRLPGE